MHQDRLLRETYVHEMRHRFYHAMQWLIACLVIAFLVLQTFPQLLFAHSVSYRNITIFSRDLLATESQTCIDQTMALLKKSEIAQEDRKLRVFLCNNVLSYNFFGPFRGRSFAISVPVTENIFIANGDPSTDLALRNAPIYNRRKLSAVMAHEITHGLIRSKIGFWRTWRLPAWINEGYCDYIAQESSFPTAKGVELIVSEADDPDPSFRYFLWRQMIAYLVQERHMSFDQIVAHSGDHDSVKRETIENLKLSEPTD